MSKRKPLLKANTETLYKLYTENEILTTKDIVEAFNVSYTTAINLMIAADDYCAEHGIKIYKPNGQRIVTVDVLFEMYEWNVQSILKKAKLLGLSK